VIAHGGTVGLVVEIASAVAIAALLVWAAIRSRNDEDGRKGRPPSPPSERRG
jgi:hypothetical protein